MGGVLFTDMRLGDSNENYFQLRHRNALGNTRKSLTSCGLTTEKWTKQDNGKPHANCRYLLIRLIRGAYVFFDSAFQSPMHPRCPDVFPVTPVVVSSEQR